MKFLDPGIANDLFNRKYKVPYPNSIKVDGSNLKKEYILKKR